MEEMYDMLKAQHKNRVSKTPERLAYAVNQFEKYGIDYAVKNEETGHIHCKDETGQLYQYWAGTGKIMGSEARGIQALINELNK